MQTAGRLGRAALPVVGAGVAAAVSAGPAHADAQAVGQQTPRFAFQDVWELADVDKNTVLFTPEDIDGAADMLKRPLTPAAIDQGDSSDLSSDGTADEIIERSSFYDGLQAAGSSGIVGMDSRLLTVAARLLKSPGMQREIMSAALADPEVFDILLGKLDQPGYLEAQGFAARGLLPEPSCRQPSSARSCTHIQDCTEEDPDSGSLLDLLDEVTAWAADCVEGLGYRVLALARWMKAKLTGVQVQQGPAAASSSAAEGSGARASSTGGGNRLHRIVGGGALVLVTAMVAVVAVALLKKPVLMRRVATAASSRRI